MDEDQLQRILTRARLGANPCRNIRELFVRHFVAGGTEQEAFFDCHSNNDDCESRRDRERDRDRGRDVGHDSDAMRCALERTATNIQMMLNSLDEMAPPNRPIGFTLEITTALAVNDDKRSGGAAASGRITGHPVTVQMPLQFDPRTRQLSTSCPGQQQQQQHRHQRQASICGSRSTGPQKYPTGKSADEKFFACDSTADRMVSEKYMTCDSCGSCQTDSEGFYAYDPDPSSLGSCGDTTSRVVTQCRCKTHTCWYEQDSREVISITAIPCPKPCAMPVPVPEPLPPPPAPEPEPAAPVVVPPPVEPFPPVLEEYETESETTETAVISETASVETLTPEIMPPAPAPQPPKIEAPQPEPAPAVPQGKRYYLARPQHKEFSNCSPCRYDPSPIVDDEGNVFCPGNCGCCQCAWKPRNFEDNVEHTQVKVCRCITRGTIFTSFADRETCSTTSSFDLCPCREKAEAKFLELYHCEMWSEPEMIRGREVQLTEIKELLTPYPQSKPISNNAQNEE